MLVIILACVSLSLVLPSMATTMRERSHSQVVRSLWWPCVCLSRLGLDAYDDERQIAPAKHDRTIAHHPDRTMTDQGVALPPSCQTSASSSNACRLKCITCYGRFK